MSVTGRPKSTIESVDPNEVFAADKRVRHIDSAELVAYSRCLGQSPS